MKQHNIAVHVVWFLGIIGIILSAGMVWLTWTGSNIDGGLSTLAGTAVGALGAILTQTRQSSQRESDRPEPVEVTTPPGEPLETTNVSDEPKPVAYAPLTGEPDGNNAN